jgi:subtilisin family serine protease
MASSHGHGTHVAGVAAGSTVGVARSARILPYRVLDCSGVGDNLAIVRALSFYMKSDRTRPAVINMSLGGGISKILDDAIQEVVDSGTPVMVAAGNSADDACEYSPSRAPGAMSVGATNRQDRRAYFSNFGPCVAIYAPGVDITSADLFGMPAELLMMSGTSQASPLVAGLAAWVIQGQMEAARLALDVYSPDAYAVYSVLRSNGTLVNLEAPLAYGTQFYGDETGRGRLRMMGLTNEDKWFGQAASAWYAIIGVVGFFLLMVGGAYVVGVIQIAREQKSLRIPWEEAGPNSPANESSPLLSEV